MQLNAYENAVQNSNMYALIQGTQTKGGRLSTVGLLICNVRVIKSS
jgi:hypothetical protein